MPRKKHILRPSYDSMRGKSSPFLLSFPTHNPHLTPTPPNNCENEILHKWLLVALQVHCSWWQRLSWISRAGEACIAVHTRWHCTTKNSRAQAMIWKTRGNYLPHSATNGRLGQLGEYLQCWDNGDGSARGTGLGRNNKPLKLKELPIYLFV